MSAANPVSAPPTAAVGHLPVALWLLTTTVANRDDARRLAGLVLQQALAACVQIQQIESHYRWDGALQHEAEWRLDCKTTAAALPALCGLLQHEHPYQVPQLTAQLLHASAAYGAWAQEQVAQP